MITQEKEITAQKVTDLLYKTYGTDSGIIFGINNPQIVTAIIEFTLRYVDRHSEPKEENEVF